MSIIDQEKEIETKLIKSTFSTGIDIIGSAILGPVWSFKNLVGNCYSAAKQVSYYDFLYGIYKKVKEEKLKESDIEKFAKKLEKEKYFNYISNIIDSMFFSKCKIARNILGWITMKYLMEDVLDYEDLILINGLKDVFDIEINEFIKYAQIPDNGPDKQKDLGVVFIREYNNNDRAFIAKFINMGFLGNDLASNRFGGGNYPLRYVKTNVTHRLINYVEIFSKEIYDCKRFQE
ncbi:MAG: hypothetical protein IKJ19_06355 [Clostridia bacterium]|nr:hypothetical protein [Clostridia bacterium]